KGKKKLSAFF
ncbi:hypothetical protein CP8484711_1283B, partial [Chlamydia psittaci 84-8471/1]